MSVTEWLERHKPTLRQIWWSMIWDIAVAIFCFVMWILSDRDVFAALCAINLLAAGWTYYVWTLFAEIERDEASS